MIVLGISETHEAHACLVRDGKLVAAMAEERVSRLKTDSGYPRGAIDAILKEAGIAPDEIDVVAFATASDWIWRHLYKKLACFSVEDWIEENEIYWKPALLEGKPPSPFTVVDRFIEYGGDYENDPYYPALVRARQSDRSEWGRIGDQVRREAIKDHLGLDADRVHFFTHEDCHKIYGYYSAPKRPENGLILTMEGGGDYSSATVNTVSGEGSIEEHWWSNDVMAGRLYAYVTLILGMKPGQHEYKVMGLAPYGAEYHGNKSLEFFRNVNHVSGCEIVNPKIVPDMYYTVREALKAQRFDGIEWGLQTWLEELLSEWVTNNCQQYETSNVIFSGGIGQNIKANKVLSELPCVDNFWAGPITGDGSLGIGAAWLATKSLNPECKIAGFDTIYLGTKHSSSDIRRSMERRNVQSSYNVIDKPSPETIASWLDDGNICARFSGRMEFGQRALGNRSILADPRRAGSVERVNQQIKYRDFWMPFTPSMTIEEAERMVHNPKGAYSPYMTMAFDLNNEFKDAIPAATHPGDKTIRPQMLKREDNPGYYDLMEAFRDKSGMACLMNTSFNLHGDAICESPDDALDTFEKSDLDVLLFDDVAITRRDLG